MRIYGFSAYNFSVKQWLDNQFQNLFLYVPFLLAGGAAIYFTAYSEPNYVYCAIIAVICLCTLRIKNVPMIIRAAVLVLFGFCYACCFTKLVNTPIVARDIHNISLNGDVLSVDYTDDKARIILSVNADDIGAGDGRANLRLTVKNFDKLPQIGDTINVRGGIFKTNSAYAPETFDFAQWAYFKNISAMGYINEINILKHNNKSNIKSWRDKIHKKANSFLADSLVLGYKSAVPKDDNKIWTASGIGHVWSISGFHMTLVGGWLFLIMYFIFRSIPKITNRIPARIPATICAWIGLMFYLFLSGVDTATLRAFLMTTLVFGAFIFGRNAISMRNVAISFCVIFFINPYCVMQAGFQLSFSAVFGLVWLYQNVNPKMPQNKLLKIIYACILTSLVATIFTAPFVAAHFGAIPIYGLIGNLILLPVFSVMIMPLVFIGVIGAIFGFTAPLCWAHNIYNWLIEIAKWISTLPCANLTVPHISNLALLLFVMAFMSLMFIKPIKIKVNYILFSLFIILAIIIVYKTPEPIFYATYDNELVAFRNDNGFLEFNKSRAANHKFAFDTWKGINGEEKETPNKRYPHNNGVYKYGNIVYIQKFVPLMKNIEKLCDDDSIKYIVSYFRINAPKCQHKILSGGFLIYPNNKVKYLQSERPWN